MGGVVVYSYLYYARTVLSLMDLCLPVLITHCTTIIVYQSLKTDSLQVLVPGTGKVKVSLNYQQSIVFRTSTVG